MKKNPFISLGIVVALLLSLFAPLGATVRHCAGAGAGAEAVVTEAHHDLPHAHDAPHSHGDGGEDHHGAADHHGAGHHDQIAAESPETISVEAGWSPSPLDRFSFCCSDGTSGPRVSRVETPTLTPVQSNWTVILLLSQFHAWLPDVATLLDVHVSSYKIGSSPPDQAVADQHTYLRTSVLLI